MILIAPQPICGKIVNIGKPRLAASTGGAYQQSICEGHKLNVVALLSHGLHILCAELLHGDIIVAQALRSHTSSTISMSVQAKGDTMLHPVFQIGQNL